MWWKIPLLVVTWEAVRFGAYKGFWAGLRAFWKWEARSGRSAE